MASVAVSKVVAPAFLSITDRNVFEMTGKIQIPVGRRSSGQIPVGCRS